MDEILGGVNGGPGHHFHAAGDDSRADDLGDAIAGGLGSGEADEQRARGFGSFQNTHRHLGDDTQQTFRADNDRQKVIAVGVELLAADADDLARYQYHFDAE